MASNTDNNSEWQEFINWKSSNKGVEAAFDKTGRLFKDFISKISFQRFFYLDTFMGMGTIDLCPLPGSLTEGDDFFANLSPLKMAPVPPSTPTCPPRKKLKFASPNKKLEPEISVKPNISSALWEDYLMASGKFRAEIISKNPGLCLLCNTRCSTRHAIHSSCKAAARSIRKSLSSIFSEQNEQNLSHSPIYIIELLELNFGDKLSPTLIAEIQSIFYNYDTMVAERLANIFSPECFQ